MISRSALYLATAMSIASRADAEPGFCSSLKPEQLHGRIAIAPIECGQAPAQLCAKLAAELMAKI